MTNITIPRVELNKPAGKFKIGDHVRKIKGSQWKGRIVGWYSTALTPVGWAVESDTEVGSVQVYPESALELVEGGTTSIATAGHDAPEVAAPKAERDALLKDAERLDFLDRNRRWKIGWSVGIAPIGNVSITSVIQPSAKPTPIREAIDAAIAKAEGGAA